MRTREASHSPLATGLRQGMTIILLLLTGSLSAEERITRNVANPLKNAAMISAPSEHDSAGTSQKLANYQQENIELKKLIALQQKKIELLEAHIKELEKHP